MGATDLRNGSSAPIIDSSTTKGFESADGGAGPKTAETADDTDEAPDIRVVKHSYTPANPADQLALTKGDLVQVYDITESGWAAGVLKDKVTMADIGEAGWFPIGYLVPQGS